jgi:predicted nucleotidyltransferase
MKQEDKNIINNFKKYLFSEYKTDIDRIIFFGSRVYGKPDKFSNYDIIIILNRENYDWKYKSEIIDKIYDFELDNEIIFDLHIISNYELENTQRGKQPFFKSVLEKGVVL